MFNLYTISTSSSNRCSEDLLSLALAALLYVQLLMELYFSLNKESRMFIHFFRFNLVSLRVKRKKWVFKCKVMKIEARHAMDMTMVGRDRGG